ncbi:Peroxisome biogenesis factor 2 [Holothuria leucospilota]|uniref:Peroxisome biogenesis factor 2 n=1 Tax=Holothuria leucospilota TaxID=206669 RepID=A0A9Q1BEE8_HOLLE|nr:Peroxisome biogenesis factor 2 [Holothuria leucospilota]
MPALHRLVHGEFELLEYTFCMSALIIVRNKNGTGDICSKMSQSSQQDNKQPVLRVSQLDSHQLDNEIHLLLKAQVNNVFHFFQASPGILSVIEPELNAALRFILWKYSIDKSSSTFGQRLLNLQYASENSSKVMTYRQKWLYALVVIGCRWFQDRSYDLSKLTDNVEAFEMVWNAIDWLERVLKIAAVVNFLVFLRQGTYQTILERLLGIRAGFDSPQAIRQVSFEFMTRELLWHGFAEFLFFLLPFVNFQRLKNNIRRRLLVGQRPSTENLSEVRRAQFLYEECAVCGEWPTNPQEIGCEHVFCFYCIKANFKADNSYTCPSCGFPVTDESGIKGVLCDVR